MIQYYGTKDKLKFQYESTFTKKQLEPQSSDTVLIKEHYTKTTLKNLVNNKKLNFPFACTNIKNYESFLISSAKELNDLSSNQNYYLFDSELYSHLIPFSSITNGNKIIFGKTGWSIPVTKKILNQPTEFKNVIAFCKKEETAFAVNTTSQNLNILNNLIFSYSRENKIKIIYFYYLWLIHCNPNLKIKIPKLKTLISLLGTCTFPGFVGEVLASLHYNTGNKKYFNTFYKGFNNYIYKFYRCKTSLKEFPIFPSEAIIGNYGLQSLSFSNLQKYNLVQSSVCLNDELISYLALDPKKIFEDIYKNFTPKEKSLFEEIILSFDERNYKINQNIIYTNCQLRVLNELSSGAKIRIQLIKKNNSEIFFMDKLLEKFEEEINKFEEDIIISVPASTVKAIMTAPHTKTSFYSSQTYAPGYIKDNILYLEQGNLEICSASLIKKG